MNMEVGGLKQILDKFDSLEKNVKIKPKSLRILMLRLITAVPWLKINWDAVEAQNAAKIQLTGQVGMKIN